LRSLGLSFNNIEAIHPEAFNNQTKLTEIAFMGNNCADDGLLNPENEILDMNLVQENFQSCFENFSKQEAL
jgi:hypothetical protein